MDPFFVIIFHKLEPRRAEGMMASLDLGEPGIREAKGSREPGQEGKKPREHLNFFSTLFCCQMKLRVSVLSNCYSVSCGIGQIWERETPKDAFGALPRPLHLNLASWDVAV